jgi:ssRNA-specific RNase YbeY (16S rRNA maturation enzyme)
MMRGIDRRKDSASMSRGHEDQVTVFVFDTQWRREIPKVELVTRDRILSTLARMRRTTKLHNAAQINVALIDDAINQEISLQVGGRKAPAEMLCFAEYPGGLPRRLWRWSAVKLGDITIARESVVRQAQLRGVSPEDRLASLLVGGTLVLLGRHDQPDERLAPGE